MKHIMVVIGLAAIPIMFLIAAAVVRHKSATAEETVVKNSAPGLFGRINTWVSRVETFIYGGHESDDDMYQVNQAKMAIAKGGMLGMGPGNSTTRDYLPQAYNDFIFAIIIEEYGFAGGAFIVFVYLVFLYRCIRIFKKCPYAFGAFLALGLSFTLAIQAIANMAVTVNLFPVTGVTLPLVSMGGTSFIFTCLAIGIILSVARNVEMSEKEALEEKTALAA
jgi:cell division protein FtsW